MTSPTASQPAPQPASLSTAREWFAHNGLTRPRERRMLSGVSAGLARRYGVDRLVMRLAMLAGVLFLSPLVYVALWVLMPSES
jgi:phage shock protein PspC (stress-responsive transcriptional regulator)